MCLNFEKQCIKDLQLIQDRGVLKTKIWFRNSNLLKMKIKKNYS